MSGQPTSSAGLEERVNRLENMLAGLTDAFRLLVRGLEDSPMAEPGERPVADAARRAHELLLVMESARAAPRTDETR